MTPVQGVSCAFANVSCAAGKEILIMKTGSTGIKVVTATLALTVLLVGGCTVGPDYEQPEFQLPDAWANAAAEDIQGDRPVIVDWWSAFGDAQLDTYIVKARRANLDLAAAVGRINEARAYYQIAGGQYWPQIAADGSFTRTEVAENGPLGGLVGATGNNPSNNWQFGLGASWELDVFGRIRRAREATRAGVEASIEDYRDVMVSLYAEVAATYVEIRTLQLRRRYARSNVTSQRETLEIVNAREQAGLVPMLDVAQARSNLANTEAQVPQLEIGLEVARNRLAILLGQLPGSLDDELGEREYPLTPPTDLIVALPAELLRRRPDVRRSERNLAAQTARIGVATADLYPSFSLTGALTVQASEFADLGQSGSVGWSLVPGLKWNLFTGGKIRGRIKVEEARTEQALAAYEKVVLTALAEVENSLVALRQEEARRDLLYIAVEAAQQSVELVHTQYIAGLTDFQNYLDSERVLFRQQDEMAASRGQVVTNLINLNRALGGGWSLDEPVPDLPDENNSAATDASDADGSAAAGEEVDR